MKPLRFITLIVFLIMTLLPGSRGGADYHSANEVKQILSKVQKKLAEAKDQGADSFAVNETKRIQDQITRAEILIEKGENDMAYYEIRIGVEYFPLIKARERLLKAREAFESFDSGKGAGK